MPSLSRFLPDTGVQAISKADVARYALASVATVGVIAATIIMSRTDDSKAARPTAGAPPGPRTVYVTPTPTPKPAATLAMDAYGFDHSKARCEPTQTAVAIGRTTRSLVVVCKLQNGGYEYVGTRVSDGATLRLGNVTARADGFVAQNDSATYTVTPKELLVTSGDTVLTRETMLEYRTPSAAR
jgi:hypothetical protein